MERIFVCTNTIWIEISIYGFPKWNVFDNVNNIETNSILKLYYRFERKEYLYIASFYEMQQDRKLFSSGGSNLK